MTLRNDTAEPDDAEQSIAEAQQQAMRQRMKNADAYGLPPESVQSRNGSILAILVPILVLRRPT